MNQLLWGLCDRLALGLSQQPPGNPISKLWNTIVSHQHSAAYRGVVVKLAMGTAVRMLEKHDNQSAAESLPAYVTAFVHKTLDIVFQEIHAIVEELPMIDFTSAENNGALHCPSNISNNINNGESVPLVPFESEFNSGLGNHYMRLLISFLKTVCAVDTVADKFNLTKLHWHVIRGTMTIRDAKVYGKIVSRVVIKEIVLKRTVDKFTTLLSAIGISSFRNLSPQAAALLSSRAWTLLITMVTPLRAAQIGELDDVDLDVEKFRKKFWNNKQTQPDDSFERILCCALSALLNPSATVRFGAGATLRMGLKALKAHEMTRELAATIYARTCELLLDHGQNKDFLLTSTCERLSNLNAGRQKALTPSVQVDIYRHMFEIMVKGIRNADQLVLDHQPSPIRVNLVRILAGIAIPVFLNQRQAAWRAEVETDLKNAALAIETAAIENGGAYSTDFEDDLVAPAFRASNAATTFTVDVTDSRNFTIVANHPDLDDNATYTSSTSDIVWP